jgi:hypothetical protein
VLLRCKEKPRWLHAVGVFLWAVCGAIPRLSSLPPALHPSGLGSGVAAGRANVSPETVTSDTQYRSAMGFPWAYRPTPVSWIRRVQPRAAPNVVIDLARGAAVDLRATDKASLGERLAHGFTRL